MLGPLALFKKISVAIATCLEEFDFLAPILQRVYRAFSHDITHSNQRSDTIFVYSTEFVVKDSVPLYEAREALYAEYVVRETTGEVLNHVWQDRSKSEITAKTGELTVVGYQKVLCCSKVDQ